MDTIIGNMPLKRIGSKVMAVCSQCGGEWILKGEGEEMPKRCVKTDCRSMLWHLSPKEAAARKEADAARVKAKRLAARVKTRKAGK